MSSISSSILGERRNICLYLCDELVLFRYKESNFQSSETSHRFFSRYVYTLSGFVASEATKEVVWLRIPYGTRDIS